MGDLRHTPSFCSSACLASRDARGAGVHGLGGVLAVAAGASQLARFLRFRMALIKVRAAFSS
jgi:hypothetical protein